MKTQKMAISAFLVILFLLSFVSTASAAIPIANFKANMVTGVAPLKITFSDLSTGAPTSWTWNFGDGITSTTRNASHTYQKNGIYTVKLTVKNPSGSNTITKTNYITLKTASPVILKPVAEFTSNVTTGKAPLVVKFTDLSTNNPTSVRWYFGDGIDSSTRNATHTYTKAGAYTVKLVANNTAGSGTITKTGYIVVGSTIPIADFSYAPTIIDDYVPVQFNDKSISSSELTYKWEVINAWSKNIIATSTLKNPIFIFDLFGLGNNTVVLTVRDVFGNTVTTTKEIYVYESPKASFFADPSYEGIAPYTVTFVDSSSGYITQAYWNFGNGVEYNYKQGDVADSSMYTQTYDKPGKYIITYSITGNGGLTDTTSKMITVIQNTSIPEGNAPVPDFTVNKTSGTYPLTVKFSDLSTNNPTSVRWYFGDGLDSSTRNATHTYTKAGTYTVTLEATNAVGSSTSNKVNYITVVAPTVNIPTADFKATITTGTHPYKIYFTDLSVGSPTSWVWNFGDGITSSTQNAGHTYQNAGVYTVKLTAKNSYGSNTATKTGYIIIK
jgi:PKD repeat protein